MFPVDVGARSSGLGNANTTMIDVFALYHNQAASAFIEDKAVGFFSENRYITSELQSFGVGVSLPYTSGVLGFTLARFGFSSFNQSQLGVSVGKKLSEIVSLGVKVNVHHTHIDGFGSKVILYEELSMFAKLTDEVSLGMHLINLIQPSSGKGQNLHTTSTFKLGASYLKEDYCFFLDVYKSIRKDFNTKFGIEYLPLSSFALRIGINTIPSQFFIGFGFFYHLFTIDFSTGYLHDIGFTPSLSLCYDL